MAVKSQLSKYQNKLFKLFVAILSIALCLNVSIGPANASEGRSETDRKDALTGFQIKPVYLLPSDAPDMGDDTNGVIAGLIDVGTAFLESELGRSFPIDRTATGTYDITTIRSSYSQAEFTDDELDFRRILHESKLLNRKSVNRKIYVFFVPVEILKGGEACGYANIPGSVSLVAYQGDSCGGPAHFLNSYASKVWVHEVFHNLGVDHTEEFFDLMTAYDRCTSDLKQTIDTNRSLYAGASVYGPDILNQGVWNGMTKPTQKNQPYGCQAIYSSDQDKKADFFTCPIGKRKIGSGYYCWDNPKRAQLQELRKGKWTQVKKISVKMRNQPWESESGWGSCYKGDEAPSAAVTRKSAGAVTYRWVVDGYPDKKFKVVWQN